MTSLPTPNPRGENDSSLVFSSTALSLLSGLNAIGWRREMTPDGIITYPWISDATQALLGFKPDEMTVNSKGALTVIHWADRDSHLAAVKCSAEDQSPCLESFRAITASGETRWLEGRSQPRRSHDGTVIWDGIWMDNTSRRRAEDQQQMLLDNAEDCIFILSGDDGIIWSNGAAERNFGYLSEELRGRCIEVLIEPGWHAPCSCASPSGDDNTGGFTGNQEVMALRQDGTRFPFELTISELRRDGKLSLIVIGRDITRRRTAERLLAESEQRLRITFAAASLGIVVISLDGHIQFHNPAFEAMAGRSGDTLLGLDLALFVPLDSMVPKAKIKASAGSFAFLCRPTLGDGEERHWRLTGTQFSATPYAAEQSLLLFVEDVTETTRMNKERRQIELLLQEGQKLESLGRLAGGIAHELNNMLGPILMGAEMIARTATLDQKNQDRVNRIIDAAKNSGSIVRSVLAYSRKETKTLVPVDLAPLFNSFMDLAKSILPPSIIVEERRETDTAMVMADAGQVQQVLLNLVNNARDAMNGSGNLTLSLAILQPDQLFAKFQKVQNERSDPNSATNPLAVLDLGLPHAVIRVADTGPGITPAMAAKIFEPFFTTKPVGQGTGLGLSVVQGIVKSMGGTISVDSKPGCGAAFHVILPMIVSNLKTPP